ncbi:hypothetical protein JZO70_10195 [Enterococcus sp. 669A]|uniref:Uncharacterized protein n=1 Tax=Candidatus Enterococcus moelleringii TaxID=2815325 RepID=A0ABS3LA82_9ENTE|nr:hypothetical protein [Enterococcus sp. 669A]MBO1306534.1 hypothetical protein [Enterococcus sp. 669A]
MDQETIRAIELDRKKNRILSNLTIAFYDSNLEDGKDLVLEASGELEELKAQYYGDKSTVVEDIE